MPLPRTLLVPTDFSKTAEAALDYAVLLAAKLDARVHLLHVLGATVVGAQLGLVVTADMVAGAMTGAQQELDRLVAARAGGAAFGPTLIEIGDSRGVIEGVARTLGADLIVMGTHGRGGVRRLVLGSVAESVARSAPCPVLLVRDIESPRA